MAEQNKDQVTQLSAQLSALESESQRLLAALQWSSLVRNILLLCLVGFVVVFGWLYFKLYRDITQNKLAEFQRILNERQSELVEPLSREAFQLAQDVSPDVLKAFEWRIQSDGRKYVKAFNTERDIISQNLQAQVEDASVKLYERLLNDHEKILKEEFPQLDAQDQATLHQNMEKTYRQIAQRYYIDHFHTEIEKLTVAIDNFPMSEPDEAKGPLAQQVLYELMEMVQMMMAELEPVRVDAEAIGLEEIAAVGPCGHFFGTERTIATFETAFHRPLISTTQNYGAWAEAGGKTATERATAIWQHALKSYTEPPIDPAIREALEAFVAKRKEEGGAPID